MNSFKIGGGKKKPKKPYGKMKTFINMNFMERGIEKVNGYISESDSCPVMSDSLLPHE